MNDDDESKTIILEESFTGSNIKRFGGACVYAWFRGERCLYVGCSVKGLVRILTHNKINVVETLMDDDEIRCFWVDDGSELELEAILIEEYGPRYNRNGGYHAMPTDKELLELTCPRCDRTFKQKFWWHVTCSEDCVPMTPEERYRDFLSKI